MKTFWETPKFSDSEKPLKDWYASATAASWLTPDAIKQAYGNASFVANNRVVFNIHGNKYRLILAVAYRTGVMFVKFIGTHAQYDAIDAATVEMRK